MNEVPRVVEKVSGVITLWGVLTVVVGVLVMGSPLVSGLALAVLIGIAMVIAGLAQMLYAFQTGSIGRGIPRLLFGSITVAAGIAIVGQPGIALATLTLFLAVYFILDGFITLLASLAVAKGQGKGWLIFNGVVTLLLGVIIWRGWPVSGAWAIGILLGIRLIFSGITMLALGSAGRSAANRPV